MTSRAGSALTRSWPWAVGGALLAGLVVVGSRSHEGRTFVHLIRRAQPWWIAAAVVLQLGTYLAQGEVWRAVVRKAGDSISLGNAYRLSLAKLFVDQVVPTGGLSGTAVIARALEAQGIARPAVMAAGVVNTASYNAVFVLTLVAALAIAAARAEVGPVVLGISLAVVLLALGLAVAPMVAASRSDHEVGGPLGRIPLLRRLLEALRAADPRVSRDRGLLALASLLQLAIVLLDAATILALIASLGGNASAAGVFASFMISNVFRTIGLLPGGLGPFEVASVLTLKLAGASVAVALSATLLFRVLSFWAPMVPGFLFSREAAGRRARRGD